MLKKKAKPSGSSSRPVREPVESRARSEMRELLEEDTQIIADLREGLQIDKYALDDELIQQPDMLYRVSEHLTLRISQRDAAKQELSETEARVDADLRRDASISDTRVTEKEIESQKKVNRDVLRAVEKLRQLNLSVGKLSALKESFGSRGHALRDLTSLYAANYFSDSSNRQAEHNMRSKNAGDVRSELKKRRDKMHERK